MPIQNHAEAAARIAALTDDNLHKLALNMRLQNNLFENYTQAEMIAWLRDYVVKHG